MEGPNNHNSPSTSPSPSRSQPPSERHTTDAESIYRDRLPPADKQAEAALIGSMILDPRTIGEAMGILEGRHDFYYPSHGEIYDAITTIYNRDSTLDEVMLRSELEQRGVLDDIGGEGFIIQLAEGAPVAANAEYYATIVAGLALRRRIIYAGSAIVKTGFEVTEPYDALDAAQAALSPLALHQGSQDVSLIGAVVKESMESLFDDQAGAIATGLLDFDEQTSGGLRAGEVMILAGRPSMGKTACALSIARNIAAGGKAVLIQSMEMPRRQIGSRLIAIESGVAYSKFMRRNYNKDDYREMGRAVGLLSEMSMLIDDTGHLSIHQLRSKVRQACLGHDVGVVVVDYLQLMHGGRRFNNRQEEVSEISRGMKAIALECMVPILCLAQLNRGPDARADQRPRMSDLRESGSVEQDADIVALLYRDDYYRKSEPGHIPTNITELIIDKQRNGPAGTVELHFDAPSMRFLNSSKYGTLPFGSSSQSA